jgi:hypothetical protein
MIKENTEKAIEKIEIELSDELGSTLENITEEKLNLIYSSIVNDVSFDSISSNFNVDTSALEKSYKNSFNTLAAEIFSLMSEVQKTIESLSILYFTNTSLLYLISHSFTR